MSPRLASLPEGFAMLAARARSAAAITLARGRGARGGETPDARDASGPTETPV